MTSTRIGFKLPGPFFISGGPIFAIFSLCVWLGIVLPAYVVFYLLYGLLLMLRAGAAALVAHYDSPRR